jgi:hypothetical protein
MSGEQEVFDNGVMAEELPPSEVEDQSSGAGTAAYESMTEDYLVSLLDQKNARIVQDFRQELAQHREEQRRQIQGMTDRQLAASQKRIDVLEQKLAVAIQYAEEMSDPERVAALRAQQAQAERDREIAEIKAERDALRERANATPQERDEAAAEQADLQRWFNEEAAVRLQRYATNAGVNLQDAAIQSKWPRVMPTRADGRVDRVAFEDAIQALIDAAADQSERAAKVNRPRATPDTTRPAGAGSSNPANIIAAYARGDIGWGPQVQAALAAADK